MSGFLFTLPQRTLILLVRGYRLVLSPWIGNACRLDPTCSAYALRALEKHGAAVGTYMTLTRIARCQPFCQGGHDPVPEHPPAMFRRFITEAPRAAGGLSSISTDKTSP